MREITREADQAALDAAFSLELSQILPIDRVYCSMEQDENGDHVESVSLSFGGELETITAAVHDSQSDGFLVDWTADMKRLAVDRRGEMRALGFTVREDNGADRLYWSGVDGVSGWQSLSPFQCRQRTDQLVIMDTRSGENRLIDLRLQIGRSLSVIPFASTDTSLDINTDLLDLGNALFADRAGEFRYRLGIDTRHQTFNLMMFKKARELLLTCEAGRAEAAYWDRTFADYHENLVVSMHEKHGSYLYAGLTADMLPSYRQEQFTAACADRESVMAAQKLICMESSDLRTATLSAAVVDKAQDPAFLEELAREHITAELMRG